MNVSELEPKAAQAETFLKAMANRHRLMILCELLQGEKSVGVLQDAIGLSQSALSQHLARLRADDLVQTRRESQTIYYSIATPQVSKFIALLYEFYCGPKATSRKKPSRSKKGQLHSPRKRV